MAKLVNQLVPMEHFKGTEQQLDEAINCSHNCDDLLKSPYTRATLLSEYCSDHSTLKIDLFCKECGVEVCRECASTRRHKRHEIISCHESINEETRKLGEVADSVAELLEEMRRAVSGVKEMKQRVRNRKDDNITATREVFAALRKAIDEREDEAIADIKEGADKSEKALQLQLEILVLLWSQMKSCLELMKKTSKEKMRTENLTKRRMILEQRRDHLRLMKRRSRLDPVRNEQRKVKFEGVENLCQTISKLEFAPLDPSNCQVIIPPALVVKKEMTLMIVLKNEHGDLVTGSKEVIKVHVENTHGDESIKITPIMEVGSGQYRISFTPSVCGYYMILVLIDGVHIPGSPYKTLVYRDYNKMEQLCDQMMTQYGGNKYCRLTDVAIGLNGEVVILDRGNSCAVVLDDKLNLLKVIGAYGAYGDSRVRDPNGLAITGNIVAISDWGSHQVKKYSLSGNFISMIGSHGNKKGQFKFPRGLAFTNNQLLYVIDEGNYRVQVFRHNDTFAFSFGTEGSGPGQFKWPVRIAIDYNNNVLVTDRGANCIHLFSHSGRFIQSINCQRPFAITVSPTGHLITSHDGDDNKIRVWSPTYQMIKQFGKQGNKQGEFNAIRGISMSSTGTIYIVEYDNKRLQLITNS